MFDDSELLSLIEESKIEIANGETLSHKEMKKHLNLQDKENSDDKITFPTH